MAICKYCGDEFNLSQVRRRIGRLYGKGTYDDYFSASDVCESCAVEEISPDFGTGGEDMENAASHWDD